MSVLRVLVAEDHEKVRSAVVELLRSEFEIVGAVADGKELVQAAILLQPDVIVSDIAMPFMDGLTARKELLSAGFEEPFVFITTMHREALPQGSEEGPVGYVYKADLMTELNAAVRAVALGRFYLSRSFQEDPDDP